MKSSLSTLKTLGVAAAFVLPSIAFAYDSPYSAYDSRQTVNEPAQPIAAEQPNESNPVSGASDDTASESTAG